jgi:tRNA threonylcarbamoyladenosine biosynthesis protein TsaB
MAKIEQHYAPASLTLVLSAAEGLLQIVLAAETGRVLCAQDWDAPVRSTEILAPALRQILQGLALSPQHVGRIACVKGPGSFTGIRLTLATAAALSRVVGASMAGLDYMQALALTAGQNQAYHAGQPLWVLTHARRDMVHWQRFVWQGSAPRALAPVQLASPAEVAAQVQQSPVPPVLTGSGLARNAAAFAGLACPQALAPSFAPSHAALLALAAQAHYGHSDIEPLYVRPCDAVDNLPRMAERQGICPEEAQHTLASLLAVKPASFI